MILNGIIAPSYPLPEIIKIISGANIKQKYINGNENIESIFSVILPIRVSSSLLSASSKWLTCGTITVVNAVNIDINIEFSLVAVAKYPTCTTVHTNPKKTVLKLVYKEVRIR